MSTNLVTSDPIAALQSLGYTKREAAFLYLVAAHSGYFLRRQFDYFIDHHKGAVVVRFLHKAASLGHVSTLEYKQGWRVYHLCSRTIYGLLGDAESQLRHRKGDAQIRARLMALDYVLENEEEHFLPSATERERFFERDRRIAPSFFTGSEGRLHPLLAAFPVSLEARDHPSQSLVRFAFIDEGLLSIAKFVRFLAATERLLREVGNFELVYVGVSDFNFGPAEDAFRSRFYRTSPQHRSLFGEEIRPAALQHHPPLQAQFTTLLFHYAYPRLLGTELRGSNGGSHAEG